MSPKRVALFILAGLFLYLFLYTWNLRTGHLDALTGSLGLDVSSWVLRPGKWVADRTGSVWERYVHLVGLKQENERLAAEVRRLVMENHGLRERAEEALRLERIMGFTPPPGWTAEGARVVGERLGPASALETLVVDKGRFANVALDAPVITERGVVGRIYREGLTVATVLLVHDPNSRISVISQTTRTQGIAFGQGPGQELDVRYVNLNAAITPGEVLVTSGLAGVFPKGLPLAVVTSVTREDLSLFLTVRARPLVDPASLEEVLLLRTVPAGTGAGE
ncbi:MAG: rod shape-determining protein MreC [Desulfovibrionaceae bacterium]